MAALDSFKVDRAPAALSATALALNALVDLINNIQGGTGIKVTVSEGRILIEASQAAPDLTKGSGASSGGGAATAVTSDGTLLNGVSGNAGSSYPTKLKVVNGSDSITLDSVGLTISKSGGSLNFFMALASLGHNMSIKTITVCSGGVAKSMDVLASDPY